MRVRRTRRRLSMTSLIDVIFLLLLFFMLTSTFSRFAEVPLPLGGAGTVTTATETPPLFLRVTETGVTLNGRVTSLTDLANALPGTPDAVQRILVSVTADTSAQRLADILVTLRAVPHIAVNVLVPAR